MKKIKKTKMLVTEEWQKLFWDHVWQMHLYLFCIICDALLFFCHPNLHRLKYKLKMFLWYLTILKLSKRYMSHKKWFCIFFFQFIEFWGSFLPKCDYDISRNVFTKFQRCWMIFRVLIEKTSFFWFLKCQHYVRSFWLCP